MNKGIIVHTVVTNGEKVLITRRATVNDVLPEYWDIPGGTLEDGEDPAFGAMRETQEETGLILKQADLFFQKSNVDTGKDKQFITLIFLARYEGGDIVLNPEEHDEYAWVLPADIGKYKTVPYLNDCLEFLSSKKHTLLS